jgi:hypothetical protein
MQDIKKDTFRILLVVTFWCLTGCTDTLKGLGFNIDNQTFDEMKVIEYVVEKAIVGKSGGGYIDSFPYELVIFMRRATGGERLNYQYYSDEKCTTPLREDTLVTVDGKVPSAVARKLYSGGGGFSVYLDFLPPEGAFATLNQEWFFAKPTNSPYYREKARIITESMPIEKDPNLKPNNGE